MTDLLTEVDDMMRRERAEKLWRDHGPKFIALIAAVILATALYSAWSAWSARSKAESTDRLLALMETGAFPHNVDLDKLDMRGDVKGVTALIAAGSLMQQNERDKALAVYQAMEKDGGIKTELRQLATLMTVRLLAQKNGFDLKSLAADLKRIYGDAASPWRHHARLEAAVLTAGAKDHASAREILQPLLKEEDLPKTFLAKAKALDHVYALRAGREPARNSKS